jgi:hypothetical protein
MDDGAHDLVATTDGGRFGAPIDRRVVDDRSPRVQPAVPVGVEEPQLQ